MLVVVWATDIEGACSGKQFGSEDMVESERERERQTDRQKE